jgi:hypothetical protein
MFKTVLAFLCPIVCSASLVSSVSCSYETNSPPASASQMSQTFCDLSNTGVIADAFINSSPLPLGASTSFATGIMIGAGASGATTQSSAMVTGNYELVTSAVGTLLMSFSVSASGEYGRDGFAEVTLGSQEACSFGCPSFGSFQMSVTQGEVIPLSFSGIAQSNGNAEDGSMDGAGLQFSISFVGADGVTPALATLIDPDANPPAISPEPASLMLVFTSLCVVGLGRLKRY